MTKKKGPFFVQWILPINPNDGKEFEMFYGYDKELMPIEDAMTAKEASKIVEEILASKPINERPIGYTLFERIHTNLNINIENPSK